MRFLPNLSSANTQEGVPWDFKGKPPEQAITDKSFRDKWINDPTTSWNVFSCWEGINGTARIRKKSNEDQDDNPPSLCYGFVADYDTALTDAEVAGSFERFKPHPPNFMGRSLSGNVHLLWLFDKPIKVGSYELAEHFLDVVGERLKVSTALPCFDEGFFDVAKYYTNGAEWYELNPTRISSAVGIGWVIKASTQIKWGEKGYNVPLNIVSEQLAKVPEFVKQWDGIDFKLGAQGPTWWVPDSTSPKSAIVKESGMYTFSNNAPKDFYSWGDLIGFSFVDQYRANHIGSAVEGVHFDGRGFWREITRGDWKTFSKDDILHYLKVVRELSPAKQKEEVASELDMAYEHIIDHHNIEGAAPFVYKPNGPLSINGKPFLNTHTARVCRPVNQPVEWGHADHFPWLSRFFGLPGTCSTDASLPRFFKGGYQSLDTFISWLSHFYKSAYELNLASGHNIFVAGPVNVGKTLLNRLIIGELMGGHREAKEYLMGEDSFGAELFSVAHWVVDDGTMSTSTYAHRLWGEMVKRMAANKTFRYHEKFRSPLQVDWQGRVVVTLNADEESARMLPDLDRSILDKIELYLTSDVATVDFPDSTTLRQIIEKELPYFAKFLLDWKTPDYCLQKTKSGSIDYRFGGIKPWHDPALVKHANQSSRTSGFVEVLTDWKETYFRLINSDKPVSTQSTSWTGTAFQLRKAICEASSAAADVLRGTDNSDIGRSLAQLKAKGYPIESKDDGNVRVWTILKD